MSTSTFKSIGDADSGNLNHYYLHYYDSGAVFLRNLGSVISSTLLGATPLHNLTPGTQSNP